MYICSIDVNSIIKLTIYMKGPVDEKELLVRHAYGVGYPEPNVTFALCRGTWSSPAVSVLLSKLTLIKYHIMCQFLIE